jgi:hypothetical protein
MTAARLRGICCMYAQLSEDDDAPLDGVIYITDRRDVARLIAHSAASMGLDALSLRTLDVVVQDTCDAAGVRCG